MPSVLVSELKKLAERQRRSLDQEIVRLLSRCVEWEWRRLKFEGEYVLVPRGYKTMEVIADQHRGAEYGYKVSGHEFELMRKSEAERRHLKHLPLSARLPKDRLLLIRIDLD